MSNTIRALGAFAVALTVVVSVSACAVEKDQQNSQDISTSVPGDAPSFTGPYAGELRQAWLDSDSEFVRSVIADQTVSDSEWAEVETRIADCFEKNGMKLRGYRDDGSYELDTQGLEADKANEILPICESESGEKWLNFLRFAAAENPDGTPIEDLVVACLIRNEVVGPDYTAEQYLRDAPQMSFPYLDASTGPDAFAACSNNPSS